MFKARSFLFQLLALVTMLTVAEHSSAAAAQCSALFGEKPAASTPAIPDADLLRAVISLQSGTQPQYLARSVVRSLVNLSGASKAAELTRPETIEKLQRILQRRMGQSELEVAAGKTIASARATLLSHDRQTDVAKADTTDLHRGWGWKLLPDNDPAFVDPVYLARLVQESGARGRVLNLPTSQARANPWKEFVDAWKKLAPADLDPASIQFAHTGTDANNMLYYIAARAYKARVQPEGRELRSDVEILALDGVYGGGSGRIGRIGLFNRDASIDHLRIPSPDTPVWRPTDRAEIARLEKIENEALNAIEQRVLHGKAPIGGLLVEPVLGAAGVRFYRPEFLIKVRELCDRLKIPIFADEVLTGGGRTGKFFAYENYEGFAPDFVTFGKGLQVAGVVQSKRGREMFGEMPYRMVTLKHTNEALLKSAQIMNRIHDGKLMENAREVGNYVVEKMRAQSPPSARTNEVDAANVARGLGMLIYSPAVPKGVRDVRGRMMPPLTLSAQSADRILGPSVFNLDPSLRAKQYERVEGRPVKIKDRTLVEGSVEYGGIQPHYIVDLKNPVIAEFLNRAKVISETNEPFWTKVQKISSETRSLSLKGWEYNSPAYLELVAKYREAEQPIPLHAYLERETGVCREQGMMLHLALEKAGFDSHYLYVRSFEDGIYVEDHAIVVIKYKGEDWIVESRAQENTGRRLSDVMKPEGIQRGDPVAPMNLPAYRFDPSGTRFEAAPYPRYWLPVAN